MNDSEIAKQSIDYFHSKRERITLIKYSKLKVGAEYVDSKFLDWWWYKCVLGETKYLFHSTFSNSWQWIIKFIIDTIIIPKSNEAMFGFTIMEPTTNGNIYAIVNSISETALPILGTNVSLNWWWK